MFRILTTLLIALYALPSRAQVTGHERCMIERESDGGVFERWLESRRNLSSRKATVKYKVPVVVHVLNVGEPEGVGYNFPAERIQSQIRTLNEDYRRRAGTPGYNTNPDGGDTNIEFVLAQVDPEGNPTNGIVRVNVYAPHPSDSTRGDIITACSQYSYWDPERYLNIWSYPIPGETAEFYLGASRFPNTDLPGIPKPSLPGDGVFVNAISFGHGDTLSSVNYSQGRTLTHEIGHFLGLLHTWGALGTNRQCDAYTDYCNDTPPLATATAGCPAQRPMACDGRPAMIENYMDGSYDECMSTFTHDQTNRMHIVLENSPQRKSLLTSPVIDRTDDVTSTDDDVISSIGLYPNPATGKIFLYSKATSVRNVMVTGHTLLGASLFDRSIALSQGDNEVVLPDVHDVIIVVTVTDTKSSRRILVTLK